MGKYTVELKLQIVKEYLEGKVSLKSLGEKYCTDKSNIQKWRDAYLEHGIKGLTVQNGTYSGNFKISVVEYKKRTGASQRKTAAHFNIPSYTSVGEWERIYNEKGKEALHSETRGRNLEMRATNNKKKKENNNNNKELLKEINRLRMENDYLKKLNALVQERIKQENKKK